jgi:hypothetical protein
MFKFTMIMVVAILAVQGAVAWLLPIPYGLEGAFFLTSVITCLGGIFLGATLGSWGFFSTRPWGLVSVVMITALAVGFAAWFGIEYYRLFHLGGVPDDYTDRVSLAYAAACFFLFFLSGFIKLELGWFGLRIRRGR